jgi:hypothetical protein
MEKDEIIRQIRLNGELAYCYGAGVMYTEAREEINHLVNVIDRSYDFEEIAKEDIKDTPLAEKGIKESIEYWKENNVDYKAFIVHPQWNNEPLYIIVPLWK